MVVVGVSVARPDVDVVASLARTRTRPRPRATPPARVLVVTRAGGKGKRKGARRGEDDAMDGAMRGRVGGARDAMRAGKSLAGALGPVSRAPFDDEEVTSEHFVLARATREDGGDAGRWLPLGDVVHARGTSVDDVVRERYWILRDYAKRRHLKLNVGRGGIEIGVRVQKGPKHPRATTGEATEIVSVSDGSDVERWDETRGSDDALKFGEFPAVLRLMNNAEPVTAATKNAMLRASARFASESPGGAPSPSPSPSPPAKKMERVDKDDSVTFRFD